MLNNLNLKKDTLYIEICKMPNISKYKAIELGYYMEWDAIRIKGAFNVNNGTMKDFRRYMKDNKKYAYYMEVK